MERVTPSESERTARVDLAAAYRLCEIYGMSDMIYTHISARIPGEPEHFLINPNGMLFDEITASSLLKVHVEGRIPDESGGTRVGYSSDLKIDRRDWHLVDQRLTPAGVLLVGYDVHIGLTVEAVTPDASLHGK